MFGKASRLQALMAAQYMKAREILRRKQHAERKRLDLD